MPVADNDQYNTGRIEFIGFLWASESWHAVVIDEAYSRVSTDSIYYSNEEKDDSQNCSLHCLW